MSSTLKHGRKWYKKMAAHREKKEVATGNDSDEYEFIADNDSDSIQSLLDSDHPHAEEMAMSTMARDRLALTTPKFNLPKGSKHLDRSIDEDILPTSSQTTGNRDPRYDALDVFEPRQRSPIRRVAGADPLRIDRREEENAKSQPSTTKQDDHDEDDYASMDEVVEASAKILTIEDVEKRITKRVTAEVERKVARRLEILEDQIRRQKQELARKDELIALKEELIERFLHHRR